MHSARTAFVALAVLAGCRPQDEPGDDDGGPLDGVEISLLEAMEIAADELPGGVTLEAELMDEDDAPRYDVDRFFDDVTYEVIIDAATGEVLDIEIDPDDQGEGEELAEGLATSAMMITLEGAVEIVEGAVAEGTAVAAEPDLDERHIAVLLLGDDASLAVALVDLDDGALLDTYPVGSPPD